MLARATTIPRRKGLDGRTVRVGEVLARQGTRPGGRYARVLDQDVEAAEFGPHPLGGAGYGVRIRYVELKRDRIVANLLGGRLAAFEVPGAQQDGEAASGELPGDLEAYALVGSRDEGDGSGVHDDLLT